MRILLANYFMPPGQAPDINSLYRFTTADVRQDFFDHAAGQPFRAKNVSEWIRMRPKALRAIAASKNGHHFVKTHSKIGVIEGTPLILPDVTATAIYMMRNPFDLVLSYARHLGESVDRTIDLMQDRNAMASLPTGIYEMIGRWDDHVQSWTTAPGLDPHVIRYEDMVSDTEAVVRHLMAFLKAPINDETLSRAIEATSFSNLQKQEKELGFRERPAGMQQFFSTGKSGGWREALTPAQVGRLRKGFISTLRKHYPELLGETADIASGAAG